MSDYIIHHDVFLSGNREDIIRMLNTAIRSVGEASVIDEGDDTETISRKAGTCNHSSSPRCYTLADFLDEESRAESPVQQKILEDQQQKKQMEQDGLEPDTGCDYDVRIYDVVECEGGLKASLGMYYHDCYDSYSDDDWQTWAKGMSRLYCCKAVMDMTVYADGSLDSITTFIYEMKDGAVEETCIRPRVDFSEYISAFDRLAKIDPVRYLRYRIEDFESMEEAMRHDIETLKMQLNEAEMKAEYGDSICPDDLNDFLKAEQRKLSRESISEAFDRCIDRVVRLRNGQAEQLETLLSARAGKWRDPGFIFEKNVSEEAAERVADYYECLLLEVPAMIAQKEEELSKEPNAENEIADLPF